MKILAVDDEELVISLLSGALKSLGHTDVDFAQSGAEALEKIQRAPNPYQCLLLDIRMPGMNGIELCRNIRAMPQYRQTPVIMLTAMTEKNYIDESFLAGATDYLTKPFEMVELGARLRVADMLQREHQLVLQNAHAAQTLQQQYQNAHQFDLWEPVVLDGIPGVISSLALENYLLQLSRGDMFKNGAIGFQMEDVLTHFRQNTPTDFYYLLADVADVIFENLRMSNGMLSYFGTGAFAAVVPRVNTLDSEELAARINGDLQELDLVNSQGDSIEVSISVGPQVNSSLFGRDAKDMLMRAIEQAQPWSDQTKSRGHNIISRHMLSALTAG